MTWTDERIEQLKALWVNGQSASTIATELGHVTRNAVIGKVYRLGLAGRPGTSRPPTTSRRSTAIHSPRRRAALSIHSRPPLSPMKVVPVLPELDPAPQIPVTVATLTGDTCHWPEGDPKAPGFHFCGRRTSSSSGPYCEVHATIARARQVPD
jgi:GcrA cell cycle regulator